MGSPVGGSGGQLRVSAGRVHVAVRAGQGRGAAGPFRPARLLHAHPPCAGAGGALAVRERPRPADAVRPQLERAADPARVRAAAAAAHPPEGAADPEDRKSTRLNSSPLMRISYAVFRLKHKYTEHTITQIFNK